MELLGRHVAVTRPEGQADTLCAAIEAAGGEAIRFPVLAVRPAEDNTALDRACQHLDSYDIAFFVSPNAVHFALDFILAHSCWPEKLRVATVGKGSEKALREYGFQQIIAPSQGFDTEAVLALPEFSGEWISGRRVLVLRGNGGRGLLGEALTARGARVEFVTAYRRFCPDTDARPLLARSKAGRLDVIVMSSSEGVRNFVRIVGPEGMRVLRTVPVLASHPRIAHAAREAGFGDVSECSPGDAGVIHALRQMWAA